MPSARNETMITYINVMPNGEIVGSGVTQDGLEEFIFPVEGATTILGHHVEAGSPNYYDFLAQQIVPMPPRPKGEYRFDYALKSWVFDTAGAAKKAYAKRDELLKNGPDRISPIWWSSMTAEQQAAWSQYRQALLDVPQQAGFPADINWPTSPQV
jgi:Phage tail assembly chaperone protein